ncbi:MAG: DUF1214 domain-containing protein, partial [Prochlorococcaceae cyanobacterium]
QSAQPADLSYWRLLSELYADEPVAPRDRMMFGLLAPLGISPGQPFNPDGRQAQLRTEAALLDLTANAPVNQFWSITLYENLNCGPLMTDQGAADSRKPDLLTNPDGSMDVTLALVKPA